MGDGFWYDCNGNRQWLWVYTGNGILLGERDLWHQRKEKKPMAEETEKVAAVIELPKSEAKPVEVDHEKRITLLEVENQNLRQQLTEATIKADQAQLTATQATEQASQAVKEASQVVQEAQTVAAAAVETVQEAQEVAQEAQEANNLPQNQSGDVVDDSPKTFDQEVPKLPEPRWKKILRRVVLNEE